MNVSDTAPDAVVFRLRRLFAEWGDEQAIQFEGRWTSWAQIGAVADRLRDHLAAHAIPERVPVAIVMR